MLQAFVITLREGLEAFLIVAISLAYLRKSGRRELIPAVHWGIARRRRHQRRRRLSVAACRQSGALGRRARPGGGGLGRVAHRSHVALGTPHQARHRRPSAVLGAQARAAAAFLGVFGFTLLMITREGMETALLMGTLLFQVQAVERHRPGPLLGTLSRRSSRRCGRATGTASTWRCSSRSRPSSCWSSSSSCSSTAFHELTRSLHRFPLQRAAALGDGAVRPGRHATGSI